MHTTGRAWSQHACHSSRGGWHMELQATSLSSLSCCWLQSKLDSCQKLQLWLAQKQELYFMSGLERTFHPALEERWKPWECCRSAFVEELTVSSLSRHWDKGATTSRAGPWLQQPPGHCPELGSHLHLCLTHWRIHHHFQWFVPQIRLGGAELMLIQALFPHTPEISVAMLSASFLPFCWHSTDQSLWKYSNSHFRQGMLHFS